MSNCAHDVLSDEVLTVDANAPLRDQLLDIRERRVSLVAIVERGHCLSVLSVNGLDLSEGNQSYGDLVKSQPCASVSTVTSVEVLGRLFADSRIEAVVVNNELGEFVGLATRQSLLESLLSERGRSVPDLTAHDQAVHDQPASDQVDRLPSLENVTEDERSDSLMARESQFLESILTSTSHDGGLTNLVESIESLSDGMVCAILLVDEDGLRLRSGAAVSLPDEYVQAVDGLEIGPNAGCCGTAAFLNQPVIVSDIATDPLWSNFRDLALSHGLRACWSVPIRSSSREVLGTFAMYFGERRSPDAYHENLIERAAQLAAIAIERKTSEDALRDSETRSRALLEGSPICTKIIDLDSRLQYMSCAGQQQLKISDIQPFYGSTFPPELYPESWRAVVSEHLERAKGGETSSLDCPVLDTDGNEVWFDTTFVPARDKNGRIEYVIVTSVNITERKRAEDEARQYRDELAHVSRISTIGEMATGVAHELNQPLAAITSYSYVARSIVDRLDTRSDELHETLERLENQAIRAGDIVRRLRKFVTKNETVYVSTDLCALIRNVVTFVHPDIRQAETELELDFDRSTLQVQVDEIQIQQVLVNLIRNAIDAMHETPKSQRKVTVSTRILHDGRVQVAVRDAGKGLPADDLQKVFSAFFTTKQEGMGMGLAISRSIVEAHSGKLWAKPNTGPGLTFGFTIPHETAVVEETSECDATVFIVDDEVIVRDSLRILLETMGYSVLCFSSANEFIEFLEGQEFSGPACLIADVQMPEIGGIELLEHLRASGCELPVAITTGHGGKALKLKAEALGAADFLEKPFRPAQLQELIARMLCKAPGENEAA